jgi:hypothetical protein
MATALTSHAKAAHFWTLFGFLFCALVTPLCAQAPGTISGMITSKTGSLVSKATISAKNIASGETKTVVENQDGSFLLDNLSPATYEIVVTASGFAEWKTTITIRETAAQLIKVLLDTETVGAPEKQQGETSGVSGVVGRKSVSDLPLNARSASDLATLEPGVASARTQAVGQAQRGFGNQMTISGGRPRQNDSRLDGISVNDYANGPPASALGVSLGSDAVEQFTVLTSNYPAQYGRSFWRNYRRYNAVRNQRLSRKRIRVHPQQCLGRTEFLRRNQTPFSSKPIWRISGRAHLEGPYLRLW